jgi:hypothetical protein
MQHYIRGIDMEPKTQKKVHLGSQRKAGKRRLQGLDEAVEATRREIETFSSNQVDLRTREAAVERVSELAVRYTDCLDLILSETAKSIRSMHEESEFYSVTNGFSVLERVLRVAKPVTQRRVLRFLGAVVHSDWGLPRLESLETMAKVRSEAVESFLARRLKEIRRSGDARDAWRVVRERKGVGYMMEYGLGLTPQVRRSAC